MTQQTVQQHVRVYARTENGEARMKLEAKLPNRQILSKTLNIKSGHPSKERTALYGVVATMKSIKKPCEVVYETDCPYLANSYHRVDAWRKNGWLTMKKQPVRNVDLWEQLQAAVKATGSTLKFTYRAEDLKK